MAKEILCGFGVDVDAIAGWLGSYGGEDSPDDISRGLFAGEVGSPRLLKLFARLGIKTTWFIPGHSIETFPTEMKAVSDAGHEIGIHGYSHENPIAMTREQETAVLDKCIELVTQLSGRRPTGYVAPWWEFSTVTNELLLERGIKYDHSLMHHDHQPYYVRVGDSWTKIDYSKQPAEWMVPLKRGQTTDLIEIPASWYLDDLPPMMFIKKSPNSHGFVNPRDIEQMWRDQFDWVYREYDYAFSARARRRCGSVCCTIRGELSTAIKDLHSRRERGLLPPFRRLVIESTGLADPFPILSTVRSDPVLRHHFCLGNVITTVDAVNGARQLDAQPESIKQVAVADRLVLTKTDLATSEATDRLTQRLRHINPGTPLWRAAEDDLDAAALLSADGGG